MRIHLPIFNPVGVNFVYKVFRDWNVECVTLSLSIDRSFKRWMDTIKLCIENSFNYTLGNEVVVEFILD